MRTLVATALVAYASADETSLMQDLVKRSASNKLSADATSGRQDSSSKLLDTAVNMIKNGVTPDVITFVDATIQDIEDDVLPAIQSEHDIDQAYINGLCQDFMNAVAALEHQAAAIAVHDGNRMAASAAHHSCRADEALACAKSRRCEEQLREKWRIVKHEETVMREIHGHIHDEWCIHPPFFAPIDEWLSHPFNWAQTSPYPLLDLPQDVRDFRHVSVGHFTEYTAQLIIVKRAWFEYEEKVVECAGLEVEWEDHIPVCDEAQNVMHEYACQHATANRGTRAAFGQEWARITSLFDDARVAKMSDEQDRKNEWETLKIITCLLQHVHSSVITSIETGGPCPTIDSDPDGVTLAIEDCHIVTRGCDADSMTHHLCLDWCEPPPIPPLPPVELPACHPAYIAKEQAQFLAAIQTGYTARLTDNADYPTDPLTVYETVLSAAGWAGCAPPLVCVDCEGQGVEPPCLDHLTGSHTCQLHEEYLSPGHGNADTFRCLDGTCVSVAGRCNGANNCADGSDESGCDAETTPFVPAYLSTSFSCPADFHDDVHFKCATPRPATGAIGSLTIDHAQTISALNGHVVVVHAFSNAERIACGILTEDIVQGVGTGNLHVTEWAQYPGENNPGGFNVQGVVRVHATDASATTQEFEWELTGLDNACSNAVGGTCGIHIHPGTSCDSHSLVDTYQGVHRSDWANSGVSDDGEWVVAPFVPSFYSVDACIEKTGLCNGVDNCGDGSDELHCSGSLDVTVEATSGRTITVETLQTHTGVFHDREYNFDSLGHFTGKTFIKYSNDDKMTDHLHVMTKLRTLEPVTVFIVKLDHHGLPWLEMEGYTPSAYSGVSFSGVRSTHHKEWDSSLLTTDHFAASAVFSKTFPAGTISIPGNNGGDGSFLIFLDHPSADDEFDSRLSAYWESGNCGVHGNDWNWGWCSNQAGNCPLTVATDLCLSGEAELAAYHGTGAANSYTRDGCNYFWHAQYRCTPHVPEVVGEAEYIGCFVDDGARDLGDMVGTRDNAATNTFELCRAACGDSLFLSLQYGGECFCSDSYGNGAQYVQVDESECSANVEPCASTSYNCGGTWRQAIYQINHPVTYRYGDVGSGDSCPTSDVSEADCLAAVQSLLPVGQSQGRTNLVAGSWGWVPPGCSVQSHFTHNQNGDWAAHYNRGNGNNDGGYTKVCSGPATQYQILGYGMPNCASGKTIDTYDECEAAHVALGLEVNPVWHGTHSGIPGLCSTREVDWGGGHHFHFNNQAVGVIRVDLSPVCKV